VATRRDPPPRPAQWRTGRGEGVRGTPRVVHAVAHGQAEERHAGRGDVQRSAAPAAAPAGPRRPPRRCYWESNRTDGVQAPRASRMLSSAKPHRKSSPGPTAARQRPQQQRAQSATAQQQARRLWNRLHHAEREGVRLQNRPLARSARHGKSRGLHASRPTNQGPSHGVSLLRSVLPSTARKSASALRHSSGVPGQLADARAQRLTDEPEHRGAGLRCADLRQNAP
jgi:hypothetical protein